jgi:ADP-ribose pyrophosphatase
VSEPLRRRSVFAGAILDVGIESVVLPNGREVDLEIARHPGGSAAVALDEEARVCLLRQFRHAAGGWLWEIPAGKREQGEDPEQTARRELADEAGVEAARWTSLGEVLSSPAVLTEVIHLYLARELRAVETRHEPAEVLEVHWLPLAEALELANRNEIRDAKTLVGLYRAARQLSTGVPGERRKGAGSAHPRPRR